MSGTPPCQNLVRQMKTGNTLPLFSSTTMTRLLLNNLPAVAAAAAARRAAYRKASSPTTYRSLRYFSNAENLDAIVLGAYTDSGNISFPAAQSIAANTQKKLQEQLVASNLKKAGDVRLLYNVDGVKQVAVVSLGKKPEAAKPHETLEAARKAVSMQSGLFRF